MDDQHARRTQLASQAEVLAQPQWATQAAAETGLLPGSVTVEVHPVDGANSVAVTVETRTPLAAGPALERLLHDARPAVESVAGPFQVVVA